MSLVPSDSTLALGRAVKEVESEEMDWSNLWLLLQEDGTVSVTDREVCQGIGKRNG